MNNKQSDAHQGEDRGHIYIYMHAYIAFDI